MCLVPKGPDPNDAPRPVMPREAAKRVDASAQAAKFRNRQQELAARGLRSTFRTPAGGLQKPPVTAPKTLLGE